MQYRILVVDDDSMNLTTAKILLEQWEYSVEIATSGDEAIGKIQASKIPYAIVLLDYRMPGLNGAQTALQISTLSPESIVLIHSGDDSREAMKDSFRSGAVDFIEKSEDVSALQKTLERYCHKYEETLRTLRVTESKTNAEQQIASIGMVGRSQLMASLAARVAQYRTQRKPALILGDTGTGKELIARALHSGLPESFFAVNCASYADRPQLLESELFGYEKGAFTGANQAKAGIFQVARGGTVFLDELHHLSLGAQAQLLRAIQEKKIRRVGATQEIDVDFRLVAAAKPDLEERVKKGQFSPDFFFRLNYLRLDMPSLAERPEDIEPLIAHFCEQHFKETGQQKRFLMRTVRMMEKYSWPGNVRDLEAYVYRLLVESLKATIEPSDLDGRFFDPSEESKEMTLEQLEKKHDDEKRCLVLSVLKTSSSKAHAAERLRMKPTTLYSLLDRYRVGESAS